MLTDSTLEKKSPMYVGTNRIYLEGMLKKIQANKGNNTLLQVYELKNNEFVFDKQSTFYKFLPFQ
jgi:hypothetical protein